MAFATLYRTNGCPDHTGFDPGHHAELYLQKVASQIRAKVAGVKEAKYASLITGIWGWQVTGFMLILPFSYAGTTGRRLPVKKMRMMPPTKPTG